MMTEAEKYDWEQDQLSRADRRDRAAAAAKAFPIPDNPKAMETPIYLRQQKVKLLGLLDEATGKRHAELLAALDQLNQDLVRAEGQQARPDLHAFLDDLNATIAKLEAKLKG